MDTKTIAGVLLLIVGTALIFGFATLNTQIPLVLAAVGALVMAAGSLLVGTAGEGRPV